MKKEKEEIFNEAQLILAEKRTLLSVLRTGIAIIAIPLSALSFLLAFSNNYNILNSIFLSVIIFVIIFFLILLALYLIFKSLVKMQNLDTRLRKLSDKNKSISKIISD